jgi:hypothetical protein
MKQKNIYKFIVPCAALLLGLTSCNDFLTESKEDSRLTPEIAWSSPKSAEGVLLAVYTNLPSDYTAKDDWATDDMVTNLLNDPTVVMGIIITTTLHFGNTIKVTSHFLLYS